MATSQALSKKLKDYQQSVDKRIASYFESDPISEMELSKRGVQAWDDLREFSLRLGKRLRGALVLVGYDMFGGKNHKAALDAALAVELIQNYLLIVDDVMDKSLLRRGKQTVHLKYRFELKAAGEDNYKHIGDMVGVNIGLLASHAAAEIMAGINEDPERVLIANKIFQRNILTTGFGQIEDLFSGAEKPSEEDILRNYELKSSHYTFINPLQVGAALAGAEQTDINEIAKFGVPAGIAFQLQDDIISLFGTPDVDGKASNDDLKEAKYTLLIERAMSTGTVEETKLIRMALGDSELTNKRADEVRIAMRNCGAYDYCSQRARGLAGDAKLVLSQQAWNGDGVEFLDNLMDYIVERLN